MDTLLFLITFVLLCLPMVAVVAYEARRIMGARSVARAETSERAARIARRENERAARWTAKGLGRPSARPLN